MKGIDEPVSSRSSPVSYTATIAEWLSLPAAWASRRKRARKTGLFAQVGAKSLDRDRAPEFEHRNRGKPPTSLLGRGARECDIGSEEPDATLPVVACAPEAGNYRAWSAPYGVAASYVGRLRPPPWYGSDGTICIVALIHSPWVTRFLFGPSSRARQKAGTIQARVVALRPVTVEAMTTSTAATAIAISQRTQSTPGAAVAAEGAVNEPADQYAADPTEDGEPKRSVVSAAWCNELAQQADDDSGNDHSDDFHDVSFLAASYLFGELSSCGR